MVPRRLSHTSVMPAYWQAESPAEFERETGDGAEYGLANPDECCFAFSRSVAMLELMALHGSAVRWYMLYGLVAPVYGHGGALLVVPESDDPMPEAASIPPEFIPTATADDVELKQFTEFWWWLGATTEPTTGQGNVFVPSGDGTLVAQLLYGEYDEYRASVSANGCMNCVPKPFLKSAAATAAAFIALRSRLRHFARRFLNHTCSYWKSIEMFSNFYEFTYFIYLLYVNIEKVTESVPSKERIKTFSITQKLNLYYRFHFHCIFNVPCTFIHF